MLAQMLKQITVWSVIGMLAVALGACVTQKKGGLSADADKAEAESAYVRLGLAYIQDGRYDRARRHLDRALEINDESAPAIAAKGLISQEYGEYELAEKRFRQALEMDRDYTRGRSHYGVFLYNRQRYEDAFEQFRKASRDTDFEDRAGIFVNMGRAADKLERYDDAAAAYRRAMRIDRQNLRAHLGAVVALVNSGRYDEASPLFDRLKARIRRSERASHTPRSLWAGIRIARRDGELDEEASLALQLRKRFPDSEEYRKYRSMKADD